jgi:hypothetical protein
LVKVWDSARERELASVTAMVLTQGAVQVQVLASGKGPMEMLQDDYRRP